MKFRILAAGAFVLLAPLLVWPQASGVFGDWKTKTGSVVRVGSCGGAVCLTIVQLAKALGATTDIHNPDAALRSRSLCGLRIGSGFHTSDANHATGGTLYDPKSGKTYRGNLTAVGTTLHLRGYVGIPLFGASEDWTRPTAPVKPCDAAQQ